MTHIMPDAQLSGVTPRGLHEICQDARLGQCSYCAAMPGEPCVFSGSGPDGDHLARFAWAEATGLIAAADFAAALETLAQTCGNTDHSTGPEIAEATAPWPGFAVVTVCLLSLVVKPFGRCLLCRGKGNLHRKHSRRAPSARCATA